MAEPFGMGIGDHKDVIYDKCLWGERFILYWEWAFQSTTHENPWHHGYGYGITQVEYFRHHTHTCITHDLNTMGLPTPMMIPRYRVIPWCRYREWFTVVVLPLCFLCSPACEQLLTAVAAEGAQGQYRDPTDDSRCLGHVVYPSPTRQAVARQWGWVLCHRLLVALVPASWSPSPLVVCTREPLYEQMLVGVGLVLASPLPVSPSLSPLRCHTTN